MKMVRVTKPIVLVIICFTIASASNWPHYGRQRFDRTGPRWVTTESGKRIKLVKTMQVRIKDEVIKQRPWLFQFVSTDSKGYYNRYSSEPSEEGKKNATLACHVYHGDDRWIVELDEKPSEGRRWLVVLRESDFELRGEGETYWRRYTQFCNNGTPNYVNEYKSNRSEHMENIEKEQNEREAAYQKQCKAKVRAKIGERVVATLSEKFSKQFEDLGLASHCKTTKSLLVGTLISDPEDDSDDSDCTKCIVLFEGKDELIIQVSIPLHLLMKYDPEIHGAMQHNAPEAWEELLREKIADN